MSQEMFCPRPWAHEYQAEGDETNCGDLRCPYPQPRMPDGGPVSWASMFDDAPDPSSSSQRPSTEPLTEGPLDQGGER